MYSVSVPLIGALITFMSGVNSRLSGITGNLVAVLVIHAAGLAVVSAILLVTRPEQRQGQERLPLYYYLGGFVGVGTVFSSNYAFGALGASLAVALALLGQTLFSVAVDATGFMGRARYPLSVRRLPGIGLAIAGVAVMGSAAVGSGRAGPAAMLVALVSGALPALTFILNSELGRRKGIMRSTRVNFIVGLGTTLVIAAVVRPPVHEAVHALVMAGPFLALGGGLMGVVVVSVMNLVFPRMPAFSSAVLLFSGQALAGVLIDFAADGAFDVRKLVGTLVLLAGLSINGLLTRRAESAGQAAP
ncbi:MAG: DMT family transporter [Spirochaetia bacterium]